MKDWLRYSSVNYIRRHGRGTNRGSGLSSIKPVSSQFESLPVIVLGLTPNGGTADRAAVDGLPRRVSPCAAAVNRRSLAWQPAVRCPKTRETMVYLATCDAPFSLDDLAARIRKSSNFWVCWQFYQCSGIDPQSGEHSAGPRSDHRYTGTPQVPAGPFKPMYAEVFEVEPLDEHCRVDAATGELRTRWLAPPAIIWERILELARRQCSRNQRD